MKNDYLVSPSDAVKDSASGQWTLSFTVPSSGDQFTASSSSAERVASIANEQILFDLKKTQAEEPYKAGVKALLDMSLSHDGSGARAAAQVLLGSYNCHIHLDITDLCLLDTEHFTHAMAVINGRVVCGREPQEMITNGDDLFRDLWNRWEHLHCIIRYSEWYK